MILMVSREGVFGVSQRDLGGSEGRKVGQPAEDVILLPAEEDF